MTISKSENKLLSNATLVSVIADYLIFFVALKFITDITQNIFVGSYSVSVKSLGCFAGAILLPSLVDKFNVKKLITYSSFLTTVSYLLILISVVFVKNAFVTFLALFFQSLFFQIFSGSREIFSKSLGEIHEQRSLQAEILTSFFGGQFIGPILGFFLILYHQNIAAVVLCILLSLSSLYFLNSLTSNLKITGTHIFNPFKYLKLSSKLFKIYLLRGVLHWIPIGIFNYFLFAFMESHFDLPKDYSAWVYCLIALGSWFASNTLKKSKLMESVKGLKKITTFFGEKKDYQNASIAYATLGIVRFLMLATSSFLGSSIVFLIGGFCNGLNLVSAQSIRRKLCTDEQHAEIVSLEAATSKVVDGLVGTICALLATKNLISVNGAMVFSGLGLFLLSVYTKNSFKEN